VEEHEALQQRAVDLASRSQYGWGHTIDFGPFQVEGLLGKKYLRIAGVLDELGWWPASLDGLEVADVGCFTGGLSVLMAARGAAVVHAVDEVPEHLEQCRMVASAFGCDGVRTHGTTLYQLHEAIAPASLDLVMFAGVLYHLSDMLVGLLALQQLLKPGGAVLLESNAVECWDHSYANYGRYVGGMWWQPTALCIEDMCEQAGFERPEVRFYQAGRALARVVKPATASVPFKRGVNWAFPDLVDERERVLRITDLAPAPDHHANVGMLRRSLSKAAERALQAPMAAGYWWRRRTRGTRVR